jgi:hypothetical protein
MIFGAVAILLLWAPFRSATLAATPVLSELKLVTQLPGELPQRVEGLAYDGEKLWATVYHGKGSYAILNPITLGWEPLNESEHYQVISNVAGNFQSPSGICFDKGMLWITGSYGESFGAIDRQTWKVQRLFKGYLKPRRDKEASQSYSSIACDGNYIWIAWHWFRYDLPVTETQLLLKVDPESGKVVSQYPLPAGTRNDGAHGLTWDGTSLWHMKDQKLSAIDPATGKVTAQYRIGQVKRPSGLAWANNALWIAEFSGKVWYLPFR